MDYLILAYVIATPILQISILAFIYYVDQGAEEAIARAIGKNAGSGSDRGFPAFGAIANWRHVIAPTRGKGRCASIFDHRAIPRGAVFEYGPTIRGPGGHFILTVSALRVAVAS